MINEVMLMFCTALICNARLCRKKINEICQYISISIPFILIIECKKEDKKVIEYIYKLYNKAEE